MEASGCEQPSGVRFEVVRGEQPATAWERSVSLPIEKIADSLRRCRDFEHTVSKWAVVDPGTNTNHSTDRPHFNRPILPVTMCLVWLWV